MLGEKALGARDAPLGGGERTLCELRHGFETVMLHVPERPGESVVRGHHLKERIELRELGASLRRGFGGCHGLEVDRVDPAAEPENPQEPSAAKPRAHEANDDGAEPGAERPGVAELFEPTVSAKEGVVDNVFDVLRAALESDGQIEHEPGVPPVERLEGSRVASKSEGDELLVRELGHRTRLAGRTDTIPGGNEA